MKPQSLECFSISGMAAFMEVLFRYYDIMAIPQSSNREGNGRSGMDLWMDVCGKLEWED
jgi:hypothetical protein